MRLTARAPRHTPGTMNQTEAAYAAMLDLRIAAKEIACYWFESLTLKLGPDCRYTADFLVQLTDGTLELHETKGGFIRDDASVKYRVAAQMFPYRVYLAIGKKARGSWSWDIKEIAS